MIKIIILMLIIISAICKSVRDTLIHHYDESVFKKFKNQQWWNPEISWKNKYKNQDPEQGPAYFGSKTFLCMFTDAFHLFDFISIICLFLVIIVGLDTTIFYRIMRVVFLIVIYFATFELVYRCLKIRTK